MDIVLGTRGVSKDYRRLDGGVVHALDTTNLDVTTGARIAIMGRSGSGKSTLLHLLAGLDEPSDGAVFVMGEDWASMSDARRDYHRQHSIGMVYQSAHLLDDFTAVENVAIAARIAGHAPAKAMVLARTMIDEVGLGDRASHRPGALSGGQRQRVALARAMVNTPKVLLADEPTGNLDHECAIGVLDALSRVQQRVGMAIVMVTHDPLIAGMMDAIHQLEPRLPGAPRQAGLFV